MTEDKIEVLANIIDVNSKNLASGDKEVRLRLSVVGPSVILANKLGNLKPGEMVKISYDPSYQFNEKIRSD